MRHIPIALILTLIPLSAWAEPIFTGPVAAKVIKVYDGDTFTLTDGRKVRLIGVNAPELARNGSSSEPLAEAAKQSVEAFFAGDRRLRLAVGADARDRYGRTLAHVYNARGESLEAYLLARGLAFQIGIPPNLALAVCLQAQEDRARELGLGVWSNAYWRPRNADQLVSKDGGFRRLRGRIVRVDGGVGRDWWLELDGAVVLKVSRADSEHFMGWDWSALVGRQVEVRGWLVDRSAQAGLARKGFKPWLLQLRTPYAIQFRP